MIRNVNMKKLRLLLTTLVFVFVVSLCAAASEGNYIVKLKDGYVPKALEDMLTEVNFQHKLYTADNVDFYDEYCEYIEYIEENNTLDLIDGEYDECTSSEAGLFSIEDTYYSSMWQLGVVNAEFPWDVYTYGNDVNVAVIDSGCFPHADLGSAVKGGYNVMTGADPNNYTDNHGHGTHVAGIIAAQHNTIGIRGIAPKVNLYIIKITDDGKGIAYSIIANGIYKAIDEYNCKVINMSLGGVTASGTLYNAVKYAYDNGAFVIAAAGNEGEETYGTRNMYPAAYDETIGVGATNDENNRASFSQRNNTVFVAAPGYAYRSLYNQDNKYAKMNGTSQATPIVAAAAAIMLSADPDMTFDEFKAYIEETAIPLEDDYTGCGLINIEGMLRSYINSQSFYVSPWNDSAVYIKNNTTERLNVFYETQNPDGIGVSRLDAGEEKTAGFVKDKGRLLFWTDYLKPLCMPGNCR